MPRVNPHFKVHTSTANHRKMVEVWGDNELLALWLRLGVASIERWADRHNGTFEVHDLQAGRWRIKATSAGFLPLRALLDLSRETEVQLTMVRRPASYLPSPFDLMPEEQAIPPEGMTTLGSPQDRSP